MPLTRGADPQATRLLATPYKVLAYMGGLPRIYGSNVMIAEGGGESTTGVRGGPALKGLHGEKQKGLPLLRCRL
jgi:hypothetical protein